MKRLKINILFIMFLLVNTLYGYHNRADIYKFYTKAEIIEELETRIPFEAEIWIDNENRTKNDFFYIKPDGKNSYIKLENLRVDSLNSKILGNRIYFEKANERPLNERLKILLKGNIIVNWREKHKNSEILLGYIENSQSRMGREPVYLNLDESYFKKLQKLDIKVKDMDLGTGVAGHRLDSKNGGQSATISITGKRDEVVKVSIPKEAFIKNKYGDTLKVKLSFEERHQQRGEKLELTKILNGKNSNNSKGESGEIFIRGVCQTQEKSIGKYEGSFVVRVTYDD